MTSPSTSPGTAMTNSTGAIGRRWAIADAGSREPAAAKGDAAPVSAAVRATRDRRNRAARGWAFGLLIALLVQFGLGMYVNLFAHIPLNHPGHRAKNFFVGSYHSVTGAETSPHAPLILAFHAGLGLLLVLGSLWLAVLAIRGRRAGLVWAAVLGALFILGAGFNGASFLNYNEDANSFVMALLFAAAVLCYIVLLAWPGRTERQAPAA
jgi:heme A synthase